jgi:Caspase domain
MSNNHKGIGYPEELNKNSFECGKNYLLGIGIKEYQNFSKLPNARKDVEDIFALLNNKYEFDITNTETLFDEEATRINIIGKIHILADCLQTNDRLLIYFSGHGFLNSRQLGYWIPVEAQKDIIATYISNAEIRDIIKSIQAKHILLISDSCFSASLLVRDASRDIGGAFINWDKNLSRWIFISGKGVVSDGVAGKNSPFANSLIRQLKNNDKEALNILNLADSVTKEVRFNYEQQAEISPLFDTGHLGGQFVFIQRDIEVEIWNTIDKTDKLALEKFINRFPKSIWATEVNILIDKLIEKQKEDTEKQAFINAKKQRTIAYLANFKRAYPNSVYNDEIKHLLYDVEEELEWKEVKHRNTLSSYLNFIEKYPFGRFSDDSQQRIEAFYKQIDIEEEADLKRKQKPKIEKVNQENFENFESGISKPKNEKQVSLKSYKFIFVIVGLIIISSIGWIFFKSRQDHILILKDKENKINQFLSSIVPNQCYVIQGNIIEQKPIYETKTEQFKVKDESYDGSQYETITEKVMVASSLNKLIKKSVESCGKENVWSLIAIPAEYRTCTRQVVKKRGLGKVLNPAQYATIVKQVIMSTSLLNTNINENSEVFSWSETNCDTLSK